MEDLELKISLPIGFHIDFICLFSFICQLTLLLKISTWLSNARKIVVQVVFFSFQWTSSLREVKWLFDPTSAIPQLVKLCSCDYLIPSISKSFSLTIFEFPIWILQNSCICVPDHSPQINIFLWSPFCNTGNICLFCLLDRYWAVCFG